MSNAVLAIMAKLPERGETKSRLSPALEPDDAAALYEALLRDTIDLATALKGVQLAIAITPPDATEYFESICPPETMLLPVDGADIGDCLHQVLSRLLADGFARALALNSDGPTLPLAYLKRAFTTLESPEFDVVLGPCEDGGYYLIGVKEPHPGLFRGVDWSTDRVTAQTLSRARGLKLELARLPFWYDVDTAVDLERLRAELLALPETALPHTRQFFSHSGQAAMRGDQRKQQVQNL